MFAPLLIAALPASVSELDRIAARIVDDTPLASASVAVLRGHSPVLVKAYGFANLEQRVLATTSSRYFIGSITKELIAAAIEQLAEQKRIDLDAAADHYFAALGERSHPVTVAHLLSHTSGLVDYWAFGERSRRVLGGAQSRAEIEQLFVDEPLLFEPGSRYGYSNTNYYVLSEILAQVSGQGVEAYLRTSVFPKARIPKVAICDDRLVPDRAAGYTRSGDRFKNALAWGAPALLFDWVCMTAEELARWQGALSEGGVVSAATFERMSTPVPTRDGKKNGYGQGLMLGELEGHAWIGHGGNGAGYAASVRHYPADHLIVAVLVSGGSSALLAETLERAALGLAIPDRKDLPLAAGERRRYLGRYHLPRGTILILERGDRLAMIPEGAPKEDAAPIEYQGHDEFLRHGSTDRLRFEIAGERARALRVGDDAGPRLTD
jgi:CubicO group peptidase (beta-lactamase class C family)